MTELKPACVKAFEQMVLVSNEWSPRIAESNELIKPIVMAQAFAALRPLLTDECLTAVSALQNTPVGFKTDRPEGYSKEVLREIALVAMAEQASFVGNQFNIIKGNYYDTKEGWQAKLARLGATQVDPTPGAPEDVTEGPRNQHGNCNIAAKFAASASCMLHGKRYEVRAVNDGQIDGRIEVSAYGKDIKDAIDGLKGKVSARILHKLHDVVKDIQPSEVAQVMDVPTLIEAKATAPAAIEHDDGAESLAYGVHQGVYDRAQTRITDTFQRELFNELWDAVAWNDDVNALRKMLKEIDTQTKALGEENVGLLKNWCTFRGKALKGASGG
jgi:hypothetical protein